MGGGVTGPKSSPPQESHALLFMLARTRLLRPTPRAACVRSLAHKAASDAPKAIPERTTAAGPLPGPGGE
jgi:hypothetical protein